MEFFEIKAILKYQHYANKESWEQTRFLAYLIAQTNSTKKIQISDIMKFPWDSESNDNVVTKKEADELKERAKAMEQLLNK